MGVCKFQLNSKPNGARLHSTWSAPWLCHCARDGVCSEWHGDFLALGYYEGKHQSYRPVLALLPISRNPLRGNETWALKANLYCQLAGFPPRQTTTSCFWAEVVSCANYPTATNYPWTTPGSAQCLILENSFGSMAPKCSTNPHPQQWWPMNVNPRPVVLTFYWASSPHLLRGYILSVLTTPIHVKGYLYEMMDVLIWLQ